MRIVEGRAYFRGRLESLALGIEDGKVAVVRKSLEGDDRVDHGDAIILPGCVDLHVHLRDPGLTEKEDFPSGTRSAALGGVTTIMDMPNTRPPVTTRSSLEAKAAGLAGRAAVDYGLYGAPRSGSAVRALHEALAFKVYMAESTGALQIDADALEDVLRESEASGRLVVAHAEDAKKFGQGPPASLKEHNAWRPKEAEAEAVRTLARLRGGARTHVAHVTCVEALDEVPAGVSSEVTPHHLLLDSSMPLKAFGKVNPPLRSPGDRAALWDAFVAGRIDAVASDHAPHTREEKEERFEEAPSGLPGVATSLPLLLRLVKAEKFTLDRLVTAMATRPAQILGIDKGAIEVGREADLVVVDPRDVRRVTAKRVRYKCGWTPFEGMEAIFPSHVYLHGETIVEDGEFVAEGEGRPVRPPG